MNQSALVIAEFEPKTHSDYQTIDYEELELIELFKQTKNKNENQRFLIVDKDYKGIFKRLTAKIRVIKAAGGVVKNGNGEVLFIYRLGKWDLPKGKLDDGETMEIAAVREVEEECGIKVHYRGQKLATTYHLYMIRKELVFKKTNWYEMGVNNSPKLKPQKEEGITKAVWMDKSKFGKVRANTYALIEDLLDQMEATNP